MRIVTTLGVLGLMACTEQVETKVNTTPYFTDIYASPAEGITTSSELICIANAVDDDNDTLTLTYQWVTSSGSILSNADTVVLTPDTVKPNDELTCHAIATDGTNTAETTVTVTLDNTAPVIAAVSISPETVLVDSLLQCSFEASDADGEDLSISYSWTQNGTEVGTEASLQLDAQNFSDDDVIVCTVTAEDAFGGTATESAQVVVGNTAPSIGAVSLNPENAISTDDITCVVADVVDLEGDEVTVSYAWTIDGVLSEEMSDTLAGPFAVNSEILCTATPNDTKVDGTSISAALIITNSVPTVDSIDISPNDYIEANTALTCTSSVSDIDNESLTTSYSWTFNGSVLGTDATLQLDPSTTSPDDVLTCTVTVEDANGASDMASTSITVINTDPVVDTAAVITGDTYVGANLTCVATFSDLNDGALSPSYEWTVNGTSVATGDAYTLDASAVGSGNYVVCTATAVDSDGAIVSSSDAITVTNAAPFLSGVSISPDPILSTSDVMCSVANYGDTDGDDVTITYNWTVDGTMQSEHGDTLAGPFSVGASIACEAVPNDGTIDGASETATLSVSNSLPLVDSVTLNTDPVYTDGTVTATESMSDIDVEHSVTASYEWFVNGSSVQSGAMNTLDGSFFAKGDEVYVAVTPNDGVEDGVAVNSASITIANTAPAVDSVTLATVYASNTELLCDVVASDIDADSLDYTYEWSVNGTVQSETSNTFTGPFVYNEEITCTVTASDVDGLNATGNASTTVMNSVPVFDAAASITPSTVYTISALSCSGTATDADGNTPTLTYLWENTTTGTTLGTADSITLTPSDASKDDNIRCTITATDGIDTETSVANATVMNATPTVDSLSLTPTTVYTNTDIQAVATGSDVEGSTLTWNYTWFVDGVQVQDGTSDTLASSFFVKDEVVSVDVTVTDGDDTSATSTDSVTVSNALPTAPVVSITPTEPEIGVDDLLCAVDTDSTDVDGDSISYTFEWTVNGVAFNSATDSATDSLVDAADITDGDEWICTVTPDDGTDFGTSESASINLSVCTDFTIEQEDLEPFFFYSHVYNNVMYLSGFEMNYFTLETRVIDLTTQTLLSTISGVMFDLMIFSPDGTKGYALSGSDLYVVDTATHSLISTISLSYDPMAMEISSDGSQLFLGVYAGSVYVLDTSSFQQITSFSASTSYVASLDLSPDDSLLYARVGANNLTVWDTATYTNVASGMIQSNVSVQYSKLSSDGASLYYAYYDYNDSTYHVAALDVSTLTSTSPIDLGTCDYMYYFTLSSDGTRLYVPCHTDQDVKMVDTDLASTTFHTVLDTFSGFQGATTNLSTDDSVLYVTGMSNSFYGILVQGTCLP